MSRCRSVRSQPKPVRRKARLTGRPGFPATRIDVALVHARMTGQTRAASHAQTSRVRLVARVLRLRHVLDEVQYIAKCTKRRCPIRLAPQLTGRRVVALQQILEGSVGVLPFQRQCAKHAFAGVEHAEVVATPRLGRVGPGEAVRAANRPIRVSVDVVVEEADASPAQGSVPERVEEMMQRPLQPGTDVLRRRWILGWVVVFADGTADDPILAKGEFALPQDLQHLVLVTLPRASAPKAPWMNCKIEVATFPIESGVGQIKARNSWHIHYQGSIETLPRRKCRMCELLIRRCRWDANIVAITKSIARDHQVLLHKLPNFSSQTSPIETGSGANEYRAALDRKPSKRFLPPE